MSSTPLDLPVLISQLPFVQKIAHAEKAKPEVQQLLFGPAIQEQIRKQEGKVAQVEKKSEVDPVDRDGRQEKKRQEMSEKKKQESEDEESPDTGASSTSPWSGNIVNVKI